MAQENTNNFTREDVLRELELLPVWQLRSPIVVQNSLPASVTLLVPEQAPISETKTETENNTFSVEELELAKVAVELPKVTSSYRYLTCEHGHWLFIMLDAELSEDQQQLLGNIFKAMQLKMKPATVTENLAEVVNDAKPKILVAMGESTAQAMLKSLEPLDALRGTPQQFEGITLMATYDTAHLLNNLPDKAKAWADLRFAMQLMQDLNK